MSIDQAIAAAPGIRRGTEGPVFREPWEAEAFAMTLALHERGLFTWGEWTAVLADLPGPKLRVVLPGPLEINAGETRILARRDGSPADLHVTEPAALARVKPGQRVLFDDGREGLIRSGVSRVDRFNRSDDQLGPGRRLEAAPAHGARVRAFGREEFQRLDLTGGVPARHAVGVPERDGPRGKADHSAFDSRAISEDQGVG